MKNITLFTFSAFIVLLFSCKSDSNNGPNQDCIDHFLAEFNMIAYDGGSIPCQKSFIELFKAGDTFFVGLDNRCADLAAQMLVDCEGNEICIYRSIDCPGPIINATNLGIIGVTP